MTRRFWKLIAGGAAVLVMSAMLFGGVAFAQDDSAAGTGLGQTFIEKLSGKLGITSDELETAIDESANETIDDAVASGQLTESQGAALKERVAENEGLPLFGGRHGGRMGFGRAFNLETVATTLGMTTDDLRIELASGTTLTDIITAQGSSVQAVVDALVADATTRLDAAVANGRITQAQADTILAGMPARLTEMIESNMLCGPGGPRHHDFDGADSDSSTEDTTATPTV